MKSKFEVAKCTALVPAGGSMRAWTPCRDIALWGDRLCAVHRDALDGALLGLLNAKVRESLLLKFRKRQTMRATNAEAKKAAKGRATREKSS